MKIFAIGDLHLSLGTNKNMDIFGGVWDGYLNKIEENFKNLFLRRPCGFMRGYVLGHGFFRAFGRFFFSGIASGQKVFTQRKPRLLVDDGEENGGLSFGEPFNLALVSS